MWRIGIFQKEEKGLAQRKYNNQNNNRGKKHWIEIKTHVIWFPYLKIGGEREREKAGWRYWLFIPRLAIPLWEVWRAFVSEDNTIWSHLKLLMWYVSPCFTGFHANYYYLMEETSCIRASFLFCELFRAALHPGGFGYTKLAWELGSGLGNEESEFLCNLGGIWQVRNNLERRDKIACSWDLLWCKVSGENSQEKLI